MPDVRNENEMNDFFNSHNFKYGPNAFLHDESPEILICKCKIINKKTGEVVHDDTYEIHKFLNDHLVSSVVDDNRHEDPENIGLKNNILWVHAFKNIGHDNIMKFTKQRLERHKNSNNEKEVKRIREQQKAKSKKLEELFSAKLEVFNIDTIKNSKNKTLRGKIRRSQNIYELNAYTVILLMEEMQLVPEK